MQTVVSFLFLLTLFPAPFLIAVIFVCFVEITSNLGRVKREMTTYRFADGQ